MKRWARLAGLLLLAVLGRAHADHHVPPLHLGLLPYVSTQTLIARYAPLQRHLAAALKRPVKPVSAPNYATYIERTRHYEYDIYVAPPHFAALAEAEYGYRRVGRLLRELTGSIVVRKDGPVRALADLRGRVLATPDPLAIVAMLGTELLAEQHLVAGRDVTLKSMPSHNTAVLAVASGQADAAVVSEAVFDSMANDVRTALTVLVRSKAVPQIMIMASPRLSPEDLHALREAVLGFGATAAGRQFFAQTGYGGIVPIADRDISDLAPYVELLKKKVEP